jgi:plasmid stabilization system protein ParE
MNKMAFELVDTAEAGFYDIVDYYKQFDHVPSCEFIQEFEDAVQRLIKFSKAGHPYRIRQNVISIIVFASRSKEEPYAIACKVYRDELIMVFAIMHMKQKPDYWEKHLK